jgi:hypothetical protein
MAPRPDHDIWIAVLDQIFDLRNQVTAKSCNLVCSAWHTYLHPQLMSSIAIDFRYKPLTHEDWGSLRRLSHPVNRLCLYNVGTADWLLSLPAPFQGVPSLELREACFSKFADFYVFLTSKSTTLTTLALINCSVTDMPSRHEPGSYESAIAKSPIGTQMYEPRQLALHHLQLRSNADHHSFMGGFLQWLVHTPTVYTLRSLLVEVQPMIETRWAGAAPVVQHPSCKVEGICIVFPQERHMDIWGYGACFLSRISHLSPRQLTQIGIQIRI